MSGRRRAEGRRRSSTWATAAICGAAFLAGCATGPKTGRVTYECERGPRITVIFEGDRARLIRPDGPPVLLEKRRSLTGFRYESPTHSIQGRGTRLAFAIGRTMPMNCRAVG
jgi:hypothetical protein